MVSRPDPKARARRALGSKAIIKGSLVKMARTCGSKGCRCTKGDKHVSWYLSVRHEAKRTMIYVPPQLLPSVRRAVEAYQRLDSALDELTYLSVEDLKKKKRE